VKDVELGRLSWKSPSHDRGPYSGKRETGESEKEPDEGSRGCNDAGPGATACGHPLGRGKGSGTDAFLALPEETQPS